jgi:CheY-like chemotaxis protein
MSFKILFVEDDEGWRDFVATFLNANGCATLCANDATEAMEMAYETDLELILLDANLDGENGLALLEYFKLNFPRVPVVVYSGEEITPDLLNQMLAEGAAAYLKKGTPKDLLSAVKKYGQSSLAEAS